MRSAEELGFGRGVVPAPVVVRFTVAVGTVAVVAGRNPRVVDVIGCGSGLIVLRISALGISTRASTTATRPFKEGRTGTSVGRPLFGFRADIAAIFALSRQSGGRPS